MKRRTKWMVLLGLLALWMVAPPVHAANDFTKDPNCIVAIPGESVTGGVTLGVTRSSTLGGNYQAWKALNHSNSYYWSTATGQGAPSWIAYSFGAGNDYTVPTYSIFINDADAAPTDWTLDGYDGSNWTVIDTVVANTDWGVTTQTFTVDSPGAYEAYRLSVSALKNETTMRIKEWTLLYDAAYATTYVTAQLNASAQVGGTVTNSQGAYALTAMANASIVTTSADAKQGSASLDFEKDDHEFLFLPESLLPTTSPLHSGTTNYSFSTTQWVKPESIMGTNQWAYIWSKNSSLTSLRYGYSDRVQYSLQMTGTDQYIPSDDIVAINKWYFIATTYDGATKAARLYVWDDTAASETVNTTADFSAGGNPEMLAGDWVYGTIYDCSSPAAWDLDGLLDEATLWNKALSIEEIREIRGATYGGGRSTRDGWWWRRRHSN